MVYVNLLFFFVVSTPAKICGINLIHLVGACWSWHSLYSWASSLLFCLPIQITTWRGYIVPFQSKLIITIVLFFSISTIFIFSWIDFEVGNTVCFSYYWYKDVEGVDTSEQTSIMKEISWTHHSRISSLFLCECIVGKTMTSSLFSFSHR